MLSFSWHTHKIYGRGEKAESGAVRHLQNVGGGTDPTEGMHEARRILNGSERPNRLFVVVTDGWFGRRDEHYKPLLESINATRVFVGINASSTPGLAPCYDAHATVEHPNDIPPVIRAAVRSMLDEAYKRR